MSNLFVWISDVHLSLKNLDVAIQVLRQALIKARELNLPLFISGDLNDTKALMRSEWVSALIKLFSEFNDIKIYILTGNHDMDNKNSSTHSLEFLKQSSNVRIIDEPKVEYINGHPFYCIPYCINADSFREALNKARANGIKKVIGHQGVLGSHMGDYLVDESSIDPEEFADFEIILLGHYHKFQKNRNYVYCGSPFTVNVSEADQMKFFHVVKLVNNKIDFDHIQTEARRHLKIEVASDMDYQNLKPQPNTLVHVVLKGPKEFVKKYNDAEKIRNILQCLSVTIIPDIERQSEHRISADILHSPLKVIDAYLEKAETILDKNSLKEFLFKVAGSTLLSFSSKSSKNFTVKRAVGKNFLSFKDLDFTYTAMGLTSVEGFDEDTGLSPGSGKSSFFDIVIYGLFGQTSKDIKADEVINRIYKKNCEVIIYLDSIEGEYQLKRYRKHAEFDNDLVLVLPNGVELRGKDNKETQRLIEQEIGCSYEIFLKSSYFTQFGAIDRFLSASDTEKKKLISDITDLSIYDNILDSVKSFLKSLQDSLVIEDHKLLTLKTKYESTMNYLSQDQTKKDHWDQSNIHAIQLTERNIIDWNKENQDMIDQTAKFELGFNADIHQQIIVFEEEANQFEISKASKLVAIQSQIDQAQKQIEQKSFEVHDLEKQKIDTNQFNDQIKTLDEKLKAISDLSLMSLKYFTEMSSIDKEITLLQDKADKEYLKIKSGENGECFHCHQSISSELIFSVVENYKKQIGELLEKRVIIVQKDNDIKPYLLKKPDIEKERADLVSKQSSNSSIDSLIRSVNSQITFLEQNLSSLKSSYQNTEVSKSDCNYKIELIKQKKNPHTETISRLKAQVNPYDSKLAALKLEQNPHVNSIEEKKKDLVRLENESKDQELINNKLREDISFAEFWKQALHVYIKSYLMDSCLDQINDLTNEYLNTLFDGILQFNISAVTEAGKETKEKISVSIVNNGDECSYQSLSGGERCRICLALNLALSQVIMKTNGKNFGMIFLDEVLNGLDEVGKTQTMRLLKELELQFPSVFIIDHSSEFKALFTNSIMIKKKDKLSYIV